MPLSASHRALLERITTLIGNFDTLKAATNTTVENRHSFSSNHSVDSFDSFNDTFENDEDDNSHPQKPTTTIPPTIRQSGESTASWYHSVTSVINENNDDNDLENTKKRPTTPPNSPQETEPLPTFDPTILSAELDAIKAEILKLDFTDEEIRIHFIDSLSTLCEVSRNENLINLVISLLNKKPYSELDKEENPGVYTFEYAYRKRVSILKLLLELLNLMEKTPSFTKNDISSLTKQLHIINFYIQQALNQLTKKQAALQDDSSAPTAPTILLNYLLPEDLLSVLGSALKIIAQFYYDNAYLQSQNAVEMGNDLKLIEFINQVNEAKYEAVNPKTPDHPYHNDYPFDAVYLAQHLLFQQTIMALTKKSPKKDIEAAISNFDFLIRSLPAFIFRGVPATDFKIHWKALKKLNELAQTQAIDASNIQTAWLDLIVYGLGELRIQLSEIQNDSSQQDKKLRVHEMDRKLSIIFEDLPYEKAARLLGTESVALQNLTAYHQALLQIRRENNIEFCQSAHQEFLDGPQRQYRLEKAAEIDKLHQALLVLIKSNNTSSSSDMTPEEPFVNFQIDYQTFFNLSDNREELEKLDLASQQKLNQIVRLCRALANPHLQPELTPKNTQDSPSSTNTPLKKRRGTFDKLPSFSDLRKRFTRTKSQGLAKRASSPSSEGYGSGNELYSSAASSTGYSSEECSDTEPLSPSTARKGSVDTTNAYPYSDSDSASDSAKKASAQSPTSSSKTGFWKKKRPSDTTEANDTTMKNEKNERKPSRTGTVKLTSM
jgi:hypothetical protein